MPDWVEEGPFLLLYGFFLFGAFARSQTIYWLGRAVAAGTLRTRWADRVDTPRTRRASAAIDRWGLPVIPLSFLTWGFQSAVQVAAGLIRMRWLRYTLATVPGALAWALVYSAGGMAALTGAVALAAESPWALAGAAVLVAAAVVAVTRRVRRRRALAEAEAETQLVDR